MWDKLFKQTEHIKLLLSTGALMVATLVGGYNIATHFFVPMSYAEQLKTKYEKSFEALREQTMSNSNMIIEMQLIRLETKMARGETLTPTEVRQYESLKDKIK